MKYSNTAITQLTRWYKQILIKCAIFNAAVLIGGALVATPAMAERSGGIDIPEMTGNYENGSGYWYGGVVYNWEINSTINNAVFNNNSADVEGGAIYNGSEDTAKGNITIGNATFSNNSAYYGGGAIVNYAGLITINGEVLFKGNKGTSTDEYGSNGGAIASYKYALDNNGILANSGSKAIFRENSATNGGAIFSTGSDITLNDAEFISNKADGYCGAIYSKGSVTLNDVKFDSNAAGASGGAIISANDLIISNSEFKNNTAVEQGGAIDDFTDSVGSIDISGSTFENNSAGSIGAIGFFRNAVNKISDSKFIGNKADSRTPGGVTSVGSGGAIFLGSNSKLEITNGSEFTQNSATWDGGAISTRTPNQNQANSGLTVSDAIFTGNTAANRGGAIYANVWKDASLADGAKISGSTFSENSAKNGGAIYNDATTDRVGNIIISDSALTGNTASEKGGAIYNEGALTIDDATFDANQAVEGGAIFMWAEDQTVTIQNSTFTNNVADNDDVGGAISLARGTLNIDNTTFTGNTAGWSGAIFTYSDGNTLNITNSEFENNTALGVGAVQAMCNTSISNTSFTKNKATDANDDGGAALFIGAKGKATLDNVTFTENESSAHGGAISTRAQTADNSAAKLDVTNSTFTGNKAATTGGAIDNYLYGSNTDASSVYVGSSTFESNTATNGGAVYNHGEADRAGNYAKITIDSATFTGNTASSKGGAIYNMANGVVNLKGTNTFTGNTDSTGANDIYNDGELNIAGDVTLDGGISGTGKLNMTSGSLNIGTATVAADSIMFASGTTLSLDVNSETEHGTIKVSGQTFSNEGATLVPTLGSGVWSDGFKVTLIEGISDGADKFGFEDSTTNSMYTFKGIGDGTYEVSKNSDEEIIENLEEAGASAEAANIAKEIAKSTSNHDALTAVLKAAQTKNISALEDSVNKLAPSKAWEVFSTAVYTNKMLYQAVDNRLTALGKSSGDLLEGGAFWVQGLYNHAKQDGSSRVEGFNGDTSGVSFGFDTKVSEALTLGLGYGHTKTDISTDTRDLDADGDNIFVYGKYQPSAWYVNTMLAYGNSRYHEEKAPGGVQMKAKYNVNTYAANVMSGYEYANGLTPEAGLRYIHIHQNDYRDGAQRVKTDNEDVLTAVVGAKYERLVETKTLVLKPSVKVAATYDVMSDNSKANVSIIGGGHYQVEGKRLHRFGVETTLGLGTSYNNWDFDVQYVGAFREDFYSNTVLGKIRYNF